MSVQVAGNNAKISPQAKNTNPDNSTNRIGLSANKSSAQMLMPSIRKAMNIVFSRPIWSDIQPKNGRDTPLSTSPTDSAKLSAGMVSPRIDTATLSIAKSLATGASWAVTVRPPAPTMTNIAYISQNGGDLSTREGAVSRLL